MIRMNIIINNETYNIKVVKKDNGSFSGQCIEEPGAISQGETLDELRSNMIEVISLVTEDMHKSMNIEELKAVETETPDLFAAFEFEDNSLIGKSEVEIKEYRKRIMLQKMLEIRARAPKLFEALAKEDPSLIKDDDKT